MPNETEPASPVESTVLSMSKQSVVFSPLISSLQSLILQFSDLCTTTNYKLPITKRSPMPTNSSSPHLPFGENKTAEWYGKDRE